MPVLIFPLIALFGGGYLGFKLGEDASWWIKALAIIGTAGIGYWWFVGRKKRG